MLQFHRLRSLTTCRSTSLSTSDLSNSVSLPVIFKLPPASQRIPRELLYQFVGSLRPSFDICTPSIFGTSVYSSRQNDFAIYLADMKQFIALRLISQIWNEVIVPLIYQEFVIPTRFPVMRPSVFGQIPSLLPTLVNSRITNPCARVHKLVNFLLGGTGLVDTLVENMKTLVLYDFCHPFSINDYADETRLMNTIIKQFRHSKIRSLHCYGREVYAFRHPDWLDETLPNLRKTLRSLCLDAAERKAISYALVALGGVIQSLEIRNRSRLWDADYESLSNVAFQLPAETPNLETLRLIHISTSLSEFTKILSCIGTTKKCVEEDCVDSGKSDGIFVSTLKSLTVTQLFVLNEEPHVGGFYSRLAADEFSRMLDINRIAENLTYLYIGPGLYSVSDAFNVIWKPDIVTEIVKKCRRLISFSYTSFINESLVDNLPVNLQHLSLALRPSLGPPAYLANYLDSLPRFTDFVLRARKNGLRLASLTILVMDHLQRNPRFWHMSFDDANELLHTGKAELEMACAEGRIELSFDMM